MESIAPRDVEKCKKTISLRLRPTGREKTISNQKDRRQVTEKTSEKVNVDAEKHDESSSFSTEELVLSLPHVSPPEDRRRTSLRQRKPRRNVITETSDNDSEDDAYVRPKTQSDQRRKDHVSVDRVIFASGDQRARRVSGIRTAESIPVQTNEDREQLSRRGNEMSRTSSMEWINDDLDHEEFSSQIRVERRKNYHSADGPILGNDGKRASTLTDTCLAEAAVMQSNEQTHQSSVSRHYTHTTSVDNLRKKNQEARGSTLLSSRDNADISVGPTVTTDKAGSSEDLDVSDVEIYNTSEIEEKINDSALMDGTFFKVCATVTDTDRVQVRCQLCADKKKLIGSFSVSTNLVKHLRRYHEAECAKYSEHKKIKAEETRKRKRLADSKDELPVKKTRRFRQLGIDAKDFEDRVLKFVIETMSPLSITDHPSFRGLFEGINVNPVSRRSLTRRLVDVDSKRIMATKELLNKTDYVCTTADVWSAKKRSFIGLTCHFIDEAFKRQSLPLACRLFKGVHSFDKIADILYDVHTEYGLSSEKIVATVTDNARNFVKAFQEFGVHPNEIRHYAGESDSVDDDYMSSDLEAVPIPQKLPCHLRCSSHTLNLIASADLMKAIQENDMLHRRHGKTIAKCTKIWHKAALPKSAEIIIGTIGHTFSYPIVTRWNSLYDSLKQILKEVDLLPLLFERLDLKECFTAGEKLYMNEYCQVMAPIARALDILQGETKGYYGVLLPTLITLKIRIQRLAHSNLKYGKVLADASLNGLIRRFDDIFSSNDDNRCLLATISHPAFKLKWLDNANSKFDLKMDISKARDRFIEQASFCQPESMPNCSQQSVDSTSSFFRLEASPCSDFNSQDNNRQLANSNTATNVQLMAYLGDKRTQLSMLDDYPIVKQLFLKYNTPIPSSAPVERLFSFASITDTPKRHALSDKNFERIVLLKAFFKSGHKLD